MLRLRPERAGLPGRQLLLWLLSCCLPTVPASASLQRLPSAPVMPVLPPVRLLSHSVLPLLRSHQPVSLPDHCRASARCCMRHRMLSMSQACNRSRCIRCMLPVLHRALPCLRAFSHSGVPLSALLLLCQRQTVFLPSAARASLLPACSPDLLRCSERSRRGWRSSP